MHPNQIVVSPRLPEADALANWWTQHANDAFNRLSASARCLVATALGMVVAGTMP